MTLEDIAWLKKLLPQMRVADPDCRVFGSGTHGYQLGPTLSESELAGFEQTHGIRLPEEYRRFLREAGNGAAATCYRGAGPGYGLYSFKTAGLGFDLSSPFPFSSEMEEVAADAVEAWAWKNEAEFPQGSGGLMIADQGTGYDFLVVNGGAYGTVWQVFENCVRTGTTFRDWYRQWMDFLSDRALPVLATEKRLAGVTTVGMSKADVIRLCGGRWKQRGDFKGPGSTLFFEHLATQYQMDGNERVTRIIAHSIHPQNRFDFVTERILDAS